MGVAGAAYATAGSFGAFVVIKALIAFREPVFRGRRARVAFSFDRSLSLRILRYGIPSGMHVLLDMLTFTFFVFVLAVVLVSRWSRGKWKSIQLVGAGDPHHNNMA